MKDYVYGPPNELGNPSCRVCTSSYNCLIKFNLNCPDGFNLIILYLIS